MTAGVPSQSEGESVDPSAAGIDAYAELVSAETALRDVIRAAVANWIADFGEAAVANLEDKRAEEDKRRDGIAVSQDLLDYTEIHELQNIINKYWDPDVKAILDDKKRTDVYLGIIFDIRNSIGHSRPVFAAERLLLAGAAGQIRNQLARYRAKADGPQRHYPSLNSARDCMGNDAAFGNHQLSRKTTFTQRGDSSNLPRLNVGDPITFELEGTDPRGRQLVWKGYSLPEQEVPAWSVPRTEPFAEATGDRARMTWVVGDDDVGEFRQVVITLTNIGRYHRGQHCDDARIFHYHVNPPPDA